MANISWCFNPYEKCWIKSIGNSCSAYGNQLFYPFFMCSFHIGLESDAPCSKPWRRFASNAALTTLGNGRATELYKMVGLLNYSVSSLFFALFPRFWLYFPYFSFIPPTLDIPNAKWPQAIRRWLSSKPSSSSATTEGTSPGTRRQPIKFVLEPYISSVVSLYYPLGIFTVWIGNDTHFNSKWYIMWSRERWTKPWCSQKKIWSTWWVARASPHRCIETFTRRYSLAIHWCARISHHF